MWQPAISVDNLSEVSEAGTGRTGSTSGRSAYSENVEELRALLGLGEDEEVFFDRFRIDRKKLEEMILNDNEALDSTHKFFQNIMDSSGTNIAWPSRLKIGAKTKKDPHVRVAGRTLSEVLAAKETILSRLGIRNKQVTLKVNVSYTHHSHIIGEGGQTITRVRQSTGCHIHFPDSNRSFSEVKSNQVSITGSMEGVEKARAQVRDLVPLVFCFELPVLGVNQNSTESAYIQHMSDKFNVHVSYRTRSRFHATLVVIKGREWEVENVKEATLLLIKHLCGSMARQVPVQMTMEISPHHHSMVLGPQSQYLKAIMENTQTQILFPDATDPNIPALKKSNVTITGQINDVYLARQQLMGSLPITLIFTLTDAKEPLDPQKIQELSESLDVSISTRQCPKQDTISVIIRGVERNTANVYETRRRLLNVDDTVMAFIPESYIMPNAPKIFEKSEVNNNNNSNASNPRLQLQDFRLPEVRPAFSSTDLSPILLSPLPLWNMPPWTPLLVPQQPLLLPRSRPPGLMPPTRDMSINSSGYSSQFNNTTMDSTGFSAFSSMNSSTSPISPTAVSSCNMPTTPPNNLDAQFSALDLSAMQHQKSDWIERIVESPQSSTMTPGDYEQKKMMAAKAFQNKPTGVEVRTPTGTWSGYGLSLSSPTAAFKHNDFFGKPSEQFDTSIWNTNDAINSPQSQYPLEADSTFLSASNKLESIPSGMLKRIQSPEEDLPTLLTSIGLEKYIQLFASQEIDMASFQLFNEANLKELGVLAYGPRHKMLLAIAELKKRRSPIVSAAPGAERKRNNAWPCHDVTRS